MKPCTLAAAADDDITHSYRWYLQEAGVDAADGFLLAVEDALTHVRHYPGTGSPRYAPLTGIAGLRAWPMTRYPFSLLYIEHSDFIEVTRVLHQSRDIPAHLQG